MKPLQQIEGITRISSLLYCKISAFILLTLNEEYFWIPMQRLSYFNLVIVIPWRNTHQIRDIRRNHFSNFSSAAIQTFHWDRLSFWNHDFSRCKDFIATTSRYDYEYCHSLPNGRLTCLKWKCKLTILMILSFLGRDILIWMHFDTNHC